MYETESWEYYCPYLTCWKQRAAAVNSPESPRVSPAGSWTEVAAAFPSVQSSPYPFTVHPLQEEVPEVRLPDTTPDHCHEHRWLCTAPSACASPQPARGAGMCGAGMLPPS